MAKTTTSLEKVLVVPTSKLFPKGVWEGIRDENLSRWQKVIRENQKFMPRAIVEDDPSYKQIIPYLVFQRDGKVFLMRRSDKGNEKRLHNLYSLGIGGHIRKSDIASNDFFEWAKREFEEEVSYNGKFKIETLGLLNREQTPVDGVHFGLVLRLLGDSDEISTKEEHASGEMISLDKCEKYFDQMEGWSQMVYQFLKEEKNSEGLQISDMTDIENFIDGRPDWLKLRPSVLSDRDILRLVKEGDLKISPEPNWREALNTNRVDLRLGNEIRRFDYTKLDSIDVASAIKPEAVVINKVLDGQEIIIPPGELILAITKETIEIPNYLVGRLEGKSSIARHGLRVESAAWFDAGWKGAGAMEIVNQGRVPVKLYAGMPICSFSFLQLSSPTLKSYTDRNSRYSMQKAPHLGKTDEHSIFKQKLND